MPKKVYIRKSLLDQTNAAFMDPLTTKAEFGAWTELVNSLLDEWLHGRVPGASIQPFRADFEDLVAHVAAIPPPEG